MDILTRLGEKFRFGDLESERYDVEGTVAKLNCDLDTRVWLGRFGGIVGIGGYNHYGLGETTALIPGGFYAGIGGGLFADADNGRGVSLALIRAWRFGDSMTSAGDKADGEWRVTGDFLLRAGPLSGVSIDYRDFGKISMATIGLKFWL